jgi:hypothetical protein
MAKRDWAYYNKVKASQEFRSALYNDVTETEYKGHPLLIIGVHCTKHLQSVKFGLAKAKVLIENWKAVQRGAEENGFSVMGTFNRVTFNWSECSVILDYKDSILAFIAKHEKEACHA